MPCRVPVQFVPTKNLRSAPESLRGSIPTPFYSEFNIWTLPCFTFTAKAIIIKLDVLPSLNKAHDHKLGSTPPTLNASRFLLLWGMVLRYGIHQEKPLSQTEVKYFWCSPSRTPLGFEKTIRISESALLFFCFVAGHGTIAVCIAKAWLTFVLSRMHLGSPLRPVSTSEVHGFIGWLYVR